MMHSYTKAELQKEIDWKQKFISVDMDMKQRNDMYVNSVLKQNMQTS